MNSPPADQGWSALPGGLNYVAQVGFALQANRRDIELSAIESVALQRQPYLRIGAQISIHHRPTIDGPPYRGA